MKLQRIDTFWLEWCVEELEKGRSVRFLVRGWSMFPAIWPGSRVVIKPLDPSELRIGMVVAFIRAGQIVVHRIVEIERFFFKRRVIL